MWYGVLFFVGFFFFKQKTAYEMRISDWSSDVCSSDLLRLRNLGGIIILDFIDMKSEDHRAQALRALERALAADHARTQIHPFSPLGLIEMTRKRTRESLGHILCEPCPACDGSGTIKTVETVCHEIAREVQRAARQFEAKGFLVLAAPQLVQRLVAAQPSGLAGLEARKST